MGRLVHTWADLNEPWLYQNQFTKEKHDNCLENGLKVGKPIKKSHNNTTMKNILPNYPKKRVSLKLHIFWQKLCITLTRFLLRNPNFTQPLFALSIIFFLHLCSLVAKFNLFISLYLQPKMLFFYFSYFKIWNSSMKSRCFIVLKAKAKLYHLPV